MPKDWSFYIGFLLNCGTVFVPFDAPSIGGFGRISPSGVMQGCIAFPQGLGAPFGKPRSNPRSAGNKRHPGRLFFRYFLLATQKKVSRLSVREPTLNQTVASATQKSDP
jgi:hypothetical protein